MKKLVFLSLCLFMVLGALPAAADHPGSARPRDMQRLQDDLDNLDDTLRMLKANDPKANEFRVRADEIREDVTWLKVQMRRHQRSRRQGLGATVEEVNEIRASIDDLRNDIEEAYEFRFAGSDARLAEGTDIQVRLEQALSSNTARREDRVEATVVRPIRLDNRVVIPAGALVRGVVKDAEEAERPAKGGRLELLFDRIQLDGRTWVDIQTRVISIKENMDRSESAERAGIGAVLGGVLGQIIGGKKGALLGVLIGATGGIVATQGEEVELPEGTILTLRLERPLLVARR